jgi:cell division septation protein DedD
LKTRLLGAAVLIALAVLFVPMFFSSAPPTSDTDQSVSLDIPPAPDRELQSRTVRVDPNAAQNLGGTPASPSSAAPSQGSGDKLASLDIASRKPADALPEDAASMPAPTATPTPTAAKATPSPRAPAPAALAPAPAPTKPSTPVASLPAGTAARGNFSINLSAYADRAKADALVGKVRGLGYPVSTAASNQAGKSLTRVTAGPFESRAAAEAARLKIVSAVPGVPASLSAGSTSQQGDVAAKASAPAANRVAATAPVGASAATAGGFAVQLGAFSNEADAGKLRDKLRAAGMAGYVDSVSSSSGAKLFRVRAGPQTQREDAVKLRDQVKAKLGIQGVVVSAP